MSHHQSYLLSSTGSGTKETQKQQRPLPLEAHTLLEIEQIACVCGAGVVEQIQLKQKTIPRKGADTKLDTSPKALVGSEQQTGDSFSTEMS